MNEVALVQQREPDWRRLAYLSDKADVSPINLTSDELKEFIRLYRKCSSDLALVRTKSNNLELIDFLNTLVGRAYSSLYRSRTKPFFRAVADSFVLAARTVRKLRWFVLASVSIFALAIGFAVIACSSNDDLRASMEEGPMKEAFEQWKLGTVDERSLSQSVAMTGFYSAHNASVSIMEGSVAVSTFGIGSATFLWQNGIILGSLAYETYTVNKLGHLLIWISPHGVTEISGLILSGAAGLSLGWALIAPGRSKRGAALKAAGKDSIVVLSTAVILIFIAAPVEGFFSFNPKIPDAVKVGFACLAATAWVVFWTSFGKENADVPSD